MASTDRDAMVKLIRQIARKPSTNEISDADIIEDLNTFVLFDFPELLRLFTYRQTFSFYTSPNIDTYYTNPSASTTDPMANFKNVIITSHDPIYIGGYQVKLIQERNIFYRYWTTQQTRVSIGTGDGATTNFTGTFDNIPVTPRSILFSSKDSTGVAQQLIDQPRQSLVAGQLGVELINGNLYDPRGAVPDPTIASANNTMNYVTGVYDVTFSIAPATGETVYVQTIPYKASRPTAILFFDNTFTVRPIPDGSYEVKIEAYVRPAELLSASQNPELTQYWQFIAYGGAIKTLQRLNDFDQIERLFPEFDRQKALVNRRTLVELENTVAQTIYNSPHSRFYSPYNSWWNR